MEVSSKDIIFELVNTESNTEKLQNCPHREIGDLSVVYKFLVGENENGRMTMPINNEIAEEIGVSEEELYTIAYENTKQVTPFSIKSMREVLLGQMFPEGVPEENPMLDFILPPEDDDRMYVLGNSDMLKGACGILYSDMLGEFADQKECDLIILPSSIHEVIILPNKDELNTVELKNMVNEINAGVVSEEDRLSNNVYIFERGTRTLKPVFDDVPSITDSGRNMTI